MGTIINIKKLRKAIGISQYSMADELGITQSAYCKMENNEGNITFANLVRIAKLLNIRQLKVTELEIIEEKGEKVENGKRRITLKETGQKEHVIPSELLAEVNPEL